MQTGEAIGVVATVNIQHASPAAFSAHWFDRDNYNEIAEQQAFSGVDVFLGGGKKYLLPKSLGGDRVDNQNLLSEIEKRGYKTLFTAQDLHQAKEKKLWGVFADNRMAFELDRKTRAPSEPTLAQMSAKAIESLSTNPNGFFLFIEGSKVDIGAHFNDPAGVVSEFAAFDEAAEVVMKFAKDDGNTLVLVVADHTTGGITIGNDRLNTSYPETPLEALVAPIRRANVTIDRMAEDLGPNPPEIKLREAFRDAYGITDLMPEEIAKIQNTTDKDFYRMELGRAFSRRTLVGWTTRGHTGEDTFLWAYGPNQPRGLILNTDIAKIAANSMGFDLKNLNSDLFVDLMGAFHEQGVDAVIDSTESANPALSLSKNGNQAKIPISRNQMVFPNKVIELPGVVVLAKDGKIYGPRAALKAFSSHSM